MGVAGAALSGHAILVTGLAGLLAGACSMAMGEWLSVNTARESNQRQIDVEAAELETVPEEEKEELALIYQAKGLPEAQAKALAERLIANKETALDTLAREELGIDPDDLGGSPWNSSHRVILSVRAGCDLSRRAVLLRRRINRRSREPGAQRHHLFLIGAGTTLFTGRGILFSGTRQLLIGYAAAGVTFAIGHLIGVAIGG